MPSLNDNEEVESVEDRQVLKDFMYDVFVGTLKKVWPYLLGATIIVVTVSIWLDISILMAAILLILVFGFCLGSIAR